MSEHIQGAVSALSGRTEGNHGTSVFACLAQLQRIEHVTFEQSIIAKERSIKLRVP
jgi:hypothetical protein